MSRRSQLICAWAAAISVPVVGIAFCLIAGYAPPRAANDTAQQIADFYRDNTDRIRLGLLITFLAWGGYGAMTAVISAQMLRIEGRRPVLSMLQLASGVAGWVFLMVPTLVLVVATFRPERSPEATQTLHDLGWILAFMPFTPFCVQALAIAGAIFGDQSSTPVFPRWLGYFNLWAALLFLPGGLLAFFKTGPFSYQGLFVFWIPLIVFGVWILVLAWAARRAVLEEARADAPPSRAYA